MLRIVLLLVVSGISRVKLGAHSIPEVLVGFTVGALALVA
jgi:membrane-associated phospholipid phosphatase